MWKMSMGVIVFIVSTSIVIADTRVKFTGDFETGAVQASASTHDGLFVKTLPNPQGAVTQVPVGWGGAGPNSGLDTRVMASDAVGTEIVKPRSGKYFLRSAVYFNKDYSKFTGNSGKNKPRSFINVSGQPIAYDTEGYVGFSIYVPKNFENEVGMKGDQGKSQILSVMANTSSAETTYSLNVWVPPAGSEAHWYVILTLNPYATIADSRAKFEKIDIGNVMPDKGMWTDFVVRLRANPFSKQTNPAKNGIVDAKNQMYDGNKGIFQLWKAEGKPDSKGNRKMVLKISRVNAPIGLVPHKSWQLVHSFRIYKHGWHLQPTSVKGPVWFGYDEIRFGLRDRDGTGYADVNPSHLACTDGCPK